MNVAPKVTRSGTVDTEVSPRGTLELLSRREVSQLRLTNDSRLLDLFRRCALAVLNTGNETDDAAAFFEQYDDFRIEIVQRTRGIKLKIENAPSSAFVDGRMVEGVREHLFAVLRDIVYIGTEVEQSGRFDLTRSEGVTDAVFQILKHARVLNPDLRPNLVVCWGGHSISRNEYEYTKEVGYHIGLRGLDICTGCGPGAMKGPMKGAAIGHAKQRIAGARYVGLTEPGIIAAEPPNPMVNHLVVLPDIEKRLEAFVRMGHAFIVFPGGVGTAEEVLYLLGVLTEATNVEQGLPVVFTGPKESAAYFEVLDELIALALGPDARRAYRILIDDAPEVARHVGRRVRRVKNRRRLSGDAFYFNWLLNVPEASQRPFPVSHEAVARLHLSRDLPAAELAANLRRVFSAIVTGNVKDNGIRMIRERGPFEIRADVAIIEVLERVLQSFIAQGRMKLPGSSYSPCYRVVRA